MEKRTSAQVEKGTDPMADVLRLAKVVLVVIQRFLVPPFISGMKISLFYLGLFRGE